MSSQEEQQSDLDDQDRIELLRTMRRIREFESEMQVRFADGEVPGFLHLYIGEEAIAVGVEQALTENDYITSTHRGHGHCIARGLETDRMAAELYGKETGYCNGKGGSMHIADVDAGMLGANGIVAGGIPIATGAALSSKMRDSNEVAVSYFGDGALSQGAFHEAFNLAGLWNLPLVGIIENNQYGEMTGIEDHHPAESVDDLTVYGEPYGVNRVQVDGMDVEAVYSAASEAVERARAGKGPSLIECIAYRFEGHHEGDSEFYRDEDELNEWRQKDPIRTYPQELIDRSVLTESEYEEIEREIEAEIQDAVDFARQSDQPAPEAAYNGLYSDNVNANESSVPQSGDTEELTVREVISQTLGEEMEQNDRVFLQGIDVAGRGGTFNTLEGLAERFGEDRVRNTPISEVAIVGSGLGAAATGMRPVVEVMYSGFLGVAGDQLLNQVAKMRYMFGGKLDIPLTIRTQNTMGYEAAAQHSQALHNWIAAIPGIKVVCASTPADTKGLLKAAVRSDDPVMVFEHSGVYNRSGPVPTDEYVLPIGEAAVEREGEDVTVVATQVQLWNALEAAKRLESEGISVEVVNPRTIDPLDVETIAASARKTGRCVVVDDTPLSFGMQSELSSRISEEAFFDLDFPVQRIGIDDVPTPFSPPLEQEVVPDDEDIAETVRKLT
ncbi:alpha-ketoacid dehydrogenase subunit alpha/beta [Natrarchaeobius chitinivorans]|nr:dehydrogenase E1 component subunit alpha/beta [Natrarchaeobius chitinivorans]